MDISSCHHHDIITADWYNGKFKIRLENYFNVIREKYNAIHYNNALINNALINNALINNALINNALINNALINNAIVSS